MIAKLDIIIWLISAEVVRSSLCSGPKKQKICLQNVFEWNPSLQITVTLNIKVLVVSEWLGNEILKSL